MSEVQPGSGETTAESASPQTTKGTNPLRLVILLVIFGIALTGLLYDRCIARPAQKEAYDKIIAMLEDKNPDPSGDGTISDDKVQSELGLKPTETRQLSNGKIEIYSWRSGLPFRTYNLYVVYVGRKMPLLHFASPKEPSKDDLPQETIIPKRMTQEELDNFVPINPGASPDEGMAGGQRGGQRGDKSAGGKKRARKSGTPPAEKQDAQGDEAQEGEVQGDEVQEEPSKEAAEPEPPAEKDATSEEAKTAAPPAKNEDGE